MVQENKEYFGNMPYDIMTGEEMKEAMAKRKRKFFLDPAFPPHYDSLMNALMVQGVYPFKNAVHFKRPEEFMTGAINVFYEGIDPHDIRSGELGDEWLLSAIQTISENPKLVERLFITKSFNPDGFYKLKICKSGEWTEVTVDDFFPCYVNGGPIFTFGQGNELWVMLLEKAYAKLHGAYHQLIGGMISKALMDLTGCPVETVNFPDEEEKDEADE